MKLEHPEATRPRMINSERLTQDEYDSSPWTDEETALLAAEAGETLDSFGKHE